MIDKVAVKGKSEAVKVFALLDAEAADVMTLKVADKVRFAKAVSLYQAQKFNDALTIFIAIYDNNPSDMVAHLYIERINGFLRDGWDASKWDGVNRMQLK